MRAGENSHEGTFKEDAERKVRAAYRLEGTP